jgi:hypothetical protein
MYCVTNFLIYQIITLPETIAELLLHFHLRPCYYYK